MESLKKFIGPFARRYLEPNWIEAVGFGIYIALIIFAYKAFEPPVWIAMLVVLIAVPLAESVYYFIQEREKEKREAQEREDRKEEFEMLRRVRDEAEARRQTERALEPEQAYDETASDEPTVAEELAPLVLDHDELRPEPEEVISPPARTAAPPPKPPRHHIRDIT